ncbi:MAG TPA: hypothetical protein VMF65_19920 [Acidimicrobiales bacterium]|nr:hypothetical protein [Acidimicrobiales bacterium]
MVLLDGEAPFSEPGHQRGHHPPAFERVTTDLGPLLFGRFSGFVQNVGVDGKLADVVQEGRPAQAVPVSRRQVQFVGDQIREGTDPFRVAACPSVMTADGSGQRKYLLGHGDRN